MAEKYMRYSEVKEQTGGWSRTTLWRWARNGRFPKPVKIGPNTTAWKKSDIAALVEKIERESEQAA